MRTYKHNAIDLRGEKFGHLVVKVRAPNKGIAVRWVAECDCGRLCIVRAAELVRKSRDLKRGSTTSCGCRSGNWIHGARQKRTKTKAYSAWLHARDRCRNPKNPDYPDYGGRGITFSPIWDDFEVFYKEMGDSPPKTYIDRIDNNGNYEPSNCRWATPKVSANNRRPRGEGFRSSRRFIEN